MPGWWDWLTTPNLPEANTGYKPVDSLYNYYVRGASSPLGIAGMAAAAIPVAGAATRATKYLKEGLDLKPNILPAAQKASLTGYDKAKAVRDEIKQIGLTLGVPGTAYSSHGISLGRANIESTKPSNVIPEAGRTIRALWNPDYASKLNHGLVGGETVAEARDRITSTVKNVHPAWTDSQVSRAAESGLAATARVHPHQGFRDAYDLEKAGLNTAETKGGTSLGTTPELQYLLHPAVVGGKNINPLSLQVNMFDPALFGKNRPAEYFKTRAALEEMGRARKAGAANPAKQGVDYATTMFGGYGAANPVGGSRFLSELSRWALTAPDWTRRQLNLGKKTIQSVVDPRTWGNQEFNPYRRYAGYTAADAALAYGATKALTGKKQDRPQDVFDVQLPGKYGTKTGVFRPGFTEKDWAKYGTNIISGLPGIKENWNPQYQKDPYDAYFEFWRNRIHPIARTATDLVMNTDWQDKALYNKERFTKYQKLPSQEVVAQRPKISATEGAKRIGLDMFKNLAPNPYETAASKYYNPQKISDLELAAKALELPFNFYTPPYSKETTRFQRKQESAQRRAKKGRP